MELEHESMNNKGTVSISHDMSVANAVYICMCVCMSVYFRAADVLLAGAVMNRVFQPHEAHIPYILQACAIVLVLPVKPASVVLQVFLWPNMVQFPTVLAREVKQSHSPICQSIRLFVSTLSSKLTDH